MRRVNKLSGSWETGKIQPEALKHSLKAGNWWCISCLFLCRLWMSELTEAACGWIFYNRMCNLIAIHFMSWFSTNLPVDLTLHLNLTRERKTQRFNSLETWLDQSNISCRENNGFGFGDVDLYLECFTWLQTKDRHGLMRQTEPHRLQRDALLTSLKNDDSPTSGCKLQNVWRWTTAENIEQVNQLKHGKK